MSVSSYKYLHFDLSFYAVNQNKQLNNNQIDSYGNIKQTYFDIVEIRNFVKKINRLKIKTYRLNLFKFEKKIQKSAKYKE